MIVIRNVFQAKYGKGDELVAQLKEMGNTMPIAPSRILTDLMGPFFTVVLEFEAESLAEWERVMAESFGSEELEQAFARSVPLTESGRREIFAVQA